MVNLTVSTNTHLAQSHKECHFDLKNLNSQEQTDDSIVYSNKQGSSPNQFPDDSVKVLSIGAYNKRNRKAQVKKQTSL